MPTEEDPKVAIVREWFLEISEGQFCPNKDETAALLKTIASVPSREPAADEVELVRVRQELATQDNAITSDPIFLVQQKSRHVGFDANYEDDGDHLIWINGASEEEVTRASDSERFAALQAGDFGEDTEDDWEVFGFTDAWEFVQPFLTRAAAERFRVREAHNLGETRIYVESAHRNPEWRWLRGLLLGPALGHREEGRGGKALELANDLLDAIKISRLIIPTAVEADEVEAKARELVSLLEGQK